MKTVSIINLKGGVGKTTTAINMATLLATKQRKSVLLIDNDPQGNMSQFFERYDSSGRMCNTGKILQRKTPTSQLVRGIFGANGIIPTLDLIDANMSLLQADNELRASTERQDNRFKLFLETQAHKYDYCIIDNPPAILMCTINALCASHEVIVPVTLDNWALDGVETITGQIADIKALNKDLKIAGILLTNYRKSIENEAAEEWLRNSCRYPVFETKIRYSNKAVAATYYKKPLEEYSSRSAAATDYRKFVKEYTGV